MPLDPSDIAQIDAEANAIRDAWNAADRTKAPLLIREADPLVLRSLRIRSNVDPELKLAVDQEQYRRSLDS